MKRNVLGFYSDSFKVAIVIPSNKTGDKTNVMQKVYNIKRPHGYRKQSSTETSEIEIINEIQKKINDKA